jgi:selenocysteine-specific elongation factor
MLAGASGIDLVLMVIAADESIKPQTREHFEICRLLGIERGIIALTKRDLVDGDLLDLVRLEVDEFVRGSFLENAPVVAVSATTGEGLEELRAALERAASEIAGKDASRHPRLPVDRSFSVRGHGAVVTGTLIAGTLAVEDEVELYPDGIRARVRGLQVHGSAVKRARAGERTAANLAGIDSVQARRGMTLAPPGIFRATQVIDCSFELLGDAHPLKHRAPVHFHAGTAEVEAQARLLGSLEPMKPGTRGYVRFLLREPLLLLPGDRFIVRMFSPVVTIGGGVVIEAAPPVRMRRAQVAKRLGELETGVRVAVLVNESKFGISVAEVVARTGMLASEVGQPAGVARLAGDWLVSETWIDRMVAKIRETLKEFHRANPLQPGMPKESLRSRELAGGPAFLLDAVLGRARDLVAEGENVRLASHKVALKQDEEEATAKIEAQFRDGGLAVPSTAEVLAKSGVEAARARSLLQILLKNRKLVRIGDELIYHASAVEALRKSLAGRKGARFSVAEFKDWTGVSRKYAIPLLEFLDREHVTRRDGDQRVVL